MSKRSVEDSESGRVISRKTEESDAPVKQSLLGVEAVEEDGEMGEFEDPYGDEFEEEIFEAGDEDMEDEDEEKVKQKIEELDKKESEETGDIYLPHRSRPLGKDEVLEADPTVYEMLHNVSMKWPCLSFDFIDDKLGPERRSYPQTLYMATATQAEKKKDNELLVVKLSGLSKTLETEDDDADSDDDEDTEPVFECKHIPLTDTTNRLRMSRFADRTDEHLCATMSEDGRAYIWDLSNHITALDSNNSSVVTKANNRPVFTVKTHGNVEGFAVDWSPTIQTGALLTGDVVGRAFLTSRTTSSWQTEKTPFQISEDGNISIEELQWSHTEKTVFASGSTDGMIRIWDTRSKKHKPALTVTASTSDVNVMSWNSKIGYLLSSGHDDGTWSVWDLRSFKPGVSNPPTIASFNFHKAPITSIEFHPTDESIVAVSSEDNTVTLWDLSVEADDEEVKQQNIDLNGQLDDIPSQLLFVHWQKDVKEVHWHRNIPGALVSTGGEGINVWKTISV